MVDKPKPYNEALVEYTRLHKVYDAAYEARVAAELEESIAREAYQLHWRQHCVQLPKGVYPISEDEAVVLTGGDYPPITEIR